MNFKGIIIKGYSGFYYVLEEITKDKEQNNGTNRKVWECSLRGKLRLKKQTFLPGDVVVCNKTDVDKGKAVIEEVLPRRTELIRPAVANVDQVVIMLALAKPEPDLQFLDRVMIMALYHGVKPILCFNKADLVTSERGTVLQEIYQKTGFSVFVISAVKGWGVPELKEKLRNKISVLGGPSGVGKSSLMNALEDKFSLQTGEVSKKTSRGRHTTRHVELLPLSGGGLLADTPGFSRIYLPQELKREDLIKYYPDFLPYHASCKFNSCLHREEPDCCVREAVEKGALDGGRYKRYVEILSEVIAQERRY
ncbi:MAG: ribosome small subunit-dependent GTPase A [Clostridia bacterium]|nr:ribosome small subunit-dependent GTPase A [Clostridia bacterium]